MVIVRTISDVLKEMIDNKIGDYIKLNYQWNHSIKLQSYSLCCGKLSVTIYFLEGFYACVYCHFDELKSISVHYSVSNEVNVKNVENMSTTNMCVTPASKYEDGVSETHMNMLRLIEKVRKHIAEQ